MLTFEHSSGAESFGFLNSAEWFVAIAPAVPGITSSPSSCRSLVVAELGEAFPLREMSARLVQPEASSAVRAPTGSSAASVQLPSPELALVAAGVAAIVIWPRKVKRLLRKIVDGPKLF